MYDHFEKGFAKTCYHIQTVFLMIKNGRGK